MYTHFVSHVILYVKCNKGVGLCVLWYQYQYSQEKITDHLLQWYRRFLSLLVEVNQSVEQSSTFPFQGPKVV
jgi:hypothetical protein